MTKVRYHNLYFQAEDSSGAPIPEAQLFFFAEGTTTLNNTYQDEGLTLLNTNPVEANGNGRFPPIWLKSQTYTVKMTDADGGTIKTSVVDGTEPGAIASATTDDEGLVELATSAEADAGTDTTRAIVATGLEESRKRLRGSREETGTSFTLLATDAGQHIFANNGSAIAVTINTAVNAVNDIVLITQYGAGQVTLSGTATLRNANGLKTQTQYSTLQVFFKSATEAIVTGDTVA